MREIGRAAEHRDRQAVRLGDFAARRATAFVRQIEKAGIELQAVDIERRGQLDPLARGSSPPSCRAGPSRLSEMRPGGACQESSSETGLRAHSCSPGRGVGLRTGDDCRYRCVIRAEPCEQNHRKPENNQAGQRRQTFARVASSKRLISGLASSAAAIETITGKNAVVAIANSLSRDRFMADVDRRQRLTARRPGKSASHSLVCHHSSSARGLGCFQRGSSWRTNSARIVSSIVFGMTIEISA